MIIRTTRLLLALLAAPALPAGLAAADAAAAASAATGTITGRIQNVATGQYLNQARVTLQGTTQVVYTDMYGVYRLIGVPAGPASLEVFYTDLDPASIAVVVPPGGTVERDIDLTSVARYGRDPNLVKLDAFVVASDRETDAQALATNEQRFAPNIKNVLATDALGDVLGGSVGEFLKFMPGLTADYDNNDVSGVSVRGISGGMTSITTDGAPASNVWVSSTRTVDVRSMGLNDIARIELSKVPTPANPADSLAGSVNLVGKSAFERSGRQLRYGINLVGNHENLTLSKTPHSHRDRNDYKILPGFTMDFTWPISKTFGVVIAGMSTNAYTEQHFTRTLYSNVGTGTNAISASPANPFLQQYQLLDGPRNLTRNTISVKADWKVSRNGVLSVSHAGNRATTRIGTLTLLFNTGTNGTPTPATGLPMTWGPDFTRGATGRGALTNNGTNQLITQYTDTSSLNFRHDDGRWRVESGASRSASATRRRYEDAGFFYQSSAVSRNPIRVSFLGITPDKPAAIEVFDNNNQPVDWLNPDSYRGNTANTDAVHIRAQTNQGFLNVRRRFEFLPFPTSLQVGGARRVQFVDYFRHTITTTFMGPGGVGAATAPIQPYLMQNYRNVDSLYGFRNIPWMSPLRALRAYQADPRLYQMTVAQQFAAENSRLDNSEYIEETVDSAYVQAEATLFHNRLRILGGVRFEKTVDDGQGAFTDADAVWLRDAAGNYVRNAAGARIRRPEAGAVNSLEQIALTRKERAAFAHREYDGFYPSLHFTFSATENLLVRLAYASTYGRPNFTDIVPRTVATSADLDDDDPDPITGRGNLNIRNPTLEPWTADNYDLSVEYYTQHGGTISGGLFRKDLKNFFGDSSRIADAALLDELGLDRRYLGWNITTKFNSGDAKINGAEFNVRQSLRGLGKWGQYFTLFANGTYLDLDGNPGASFTSFIPKSGNWGGTFSAKRFTFTARWNHRGEDKRTPLAAFGPDGYIYYKARTSLDVNASYQLSRRFSLNASVNNVFNEPQTELRYGSSTPAYARQYEEREFAIQMAVGLRGTF
jgi:iron complex outermembrane receptor protein